MKFLIAVSLLLSAAVADSQLAEDLDLARFKTAIWENADEVASSVGVYNVTTNPYPSKVVGYNVDIDYEANCYVVFQDEEKTRYNMITAYEAPTGPFDVFLSHTGPCGVCSSLQDLGVYLTVRDLTNPVRSCGFKLTDAGKRQCIKNIGFTDRCTNIWFQNTKFTRKACLNVCLRFLRAKNNIATGKYNPCKPAEGPLPKLEEDIEDEQVPKDPDQSMNIDYSTKTVPGARKKSGIGGEVKMPLKKIGREEGPKAADSPKVGFTKAAGKFMTSLKSIRKRRKPKGCIMSINNGPACDEWQWQNGPQRLNPCLQCDECKSGPMFKKVAGRVRRNSGIVSHIARPGIPDIDHRYFSVDAINRDEL